MLKVISRSNYTFTIVSWSQEVSLDLLIIMVLSVCNESARIINTLFCARATNFVNGSETNRASFWDNDVEFILVVKNTFQRYIICLCLELLQKVTFFEIVCEINNLTLPRFTCRTNRNSESLLETTPRLVLMSWIKWRSPIWQIIFHWKSCFSR